MAYINRKQENEAGIGEKPWVPMNRWTNAANYTIVTTVTGAATYTVEVTLDQLNRMSAAEIAAADVCPIENIVDETTNGCFNVTATPAEFIRVNQTAGAGSVTFHAMQSGEAR
jgi:hypothetical protein